MVLLVGFQAEGDNDWQIRNKGTRNCLLLGCNWIMQLSNLFRAVTLPHPQESHLGDSGWVYSQLKLYYFYKSAQTKRNLSAVFRFLARRCRLRLGLQTRFSSDQGLVWLSQWTFIYLLPLFSTSRTSPPFSFMREVFQLLGSLYIWKANLCKWINSSKLERTLENTPLNGLTNEYLWEDDETCMINSTWITHTHTPTHPHPHTHTHTYKHTHIQATNNGLYKMMMW